MMVRKFHWVLPVCFLWLCPALLGEQVLGQNPFELQSRSSVQESSGPQEKWTVNPFEIVPRRHANNPDSSFTAGLNNPFEINRPVGLPSRVYPTSSQRTLTVAGQPRKPAFQAPSSNLLFWICTALLLLYTLGFSMAGHTVRQCYQAFTNENFLKLLHRQNRKKASPALLYFQLLAVLSTGLFAFLALAYYKFPLRYNMGLYLSLSAAIAGLYLGKQLLLLLVENLFLLHKPLSRYRFTLSIFLLLLGLLLFPVSALLAFTSSPLAEGSFWVGAGLIGLFFLYRYLRALFVARKYLIFHKSHFFLYLCTVEIAPAALILKLLLDFAAVG